MADTPALDRRLSTVDAVGIGVASMVGAGLFAVFAPAAAAAGPWLLAGLALAAGVAMANAASTVQLAIQYPTSGGAYVFGRRRLGPGWGFVAGWGFVVGKTASCAAMAMTVAAYAAPDGYERPTAVAVVVGLTVLAMRGITRTARAALLIAVAVVTAVLVASGVIAGGVGWDVGRALPATGHGAAGVLPAAALVFFAFAGYARIATLAEEVREPRRTLPRAVALAFAVVLPLYAVVGVVLLAALGADGLAAATAPLRDAAVTTGAPAWVGPLVAVAAALASTGALLALLTGVSRTTLAMAREADLPRPLAAIHPGRGTPWRAELAVAAAVVVLVVAVDLRHAVGVSSFGVLTYYAVANAAALTQEPAYRRFPRAVSLAGLVGCVALALATPAASLAAGATVLALGLVGRAVVRGRAA